MRNIITRTTPNASHKVTMHAQKVLMALRDEKMLTATEETKQAYREYVDKHHHVYKVHGNNAANRRITWETLEEFLAAIGSNNKEFLEKVSVTKASSNPENFTSRNKIWDAYFAVPIGEQFPVKWASEEQRNMCHLVDRMNEGQQNVLYELCYEMLPNQKAYALKRYNIASPAEMRNFDVLSLTNNHSAACKALAIDLGIAERWIEGTRRNRAQISAIPHEYIPAVSLATGVSPHWLLGSKGPVLAQRASTERVMDIFCFLPVTYQKTLSSALSLAVQSGNVVIFDEQ